MPDRDTMTVLVTGGTGFLGGRIVEKLVLEKQAKVRVLLRSTMKATRIGSLPVEYHLGDATDPAAFRKAAQGCDVVIHCASRMEHGAAPKQTTTFAGTLTAAQACAELGIPLVHISSAAVYGLPSTPQADETSPKRPRHKRDLYALAKIAAEQAVRELCAQQGLCAAILQPTMIYGPYSEEWTLSALAMLSAGHVSMPADETSVCNAVYVDDVADAALLAVAACSTDCPAWLINGGELPTWSEFLARHAALGTPGKVIPTPLAEIQRIRADRGRQRSLARTGMRLLRERPEIRSEILSTAEIGGMFSFIQRYASKQRFESIKRRLTGRAAPGVPVVDFPKLPELPVNLPYLHFLDLATQQYRFSTAKAERELGYKPQYSLDRAFAIIQAWATWSRLV